MRFQFASRTAQRVTINWMRGRRSLNWGSIERARREKEQNRRRRKWKKLKLYQTQKKNLNTFSKVFFFGRSWCRRCFFAIAYVAVLAFSSTSSEKFSIVFLSNELWRAIRCDQVLYFIAATEHSWLGFSRINRSNDLLWRLSRGRVLRLKSYRKNIFPKISLVQWTGNNYNPVY